MPSSISPPNSQRKGRVIGVLLLLQMACGLVLPFLLWRPLVTGAPAFLTAAVSNASQIRTGVFLSFIGAALTVTIAITAWPILRQYSEAIAIGFLTVCAISCTLDALQNATVMSMLSVSEEYVKGLSTDPAFVTVVAAPVAKLRRWVHYTQLLGFGAWIFLFYFSLLRFRLVPAALAILGVIGIALQFSGVTLPAFLGYSSLTELAMPLAPIHLANGLWLITRGFSTSTSTLLSQSRERPLNTT